MAIEITHPITTSDLKRLIEHQLPEPEYGMARWLEAYFLRDQEESGWFIKSLRVHQTLRGVAGISQLGGDTALTVFLARPKGVDPRLQGLETKTPLLTYRGKPKIYKSMDALYRDLKSMGGPRSLVIMREESEKLRMESRGASDMWREF